MKTHFFDILGAGALLFLAGCVTQSSVDDSETGIKRPLPFEQYETRLASTIDDSDLSVTAITGEESEQPQRNLDFPSRTSSIDADEMKVAEYPNAVIKTIPDPDTIVNVHLDFNAVSLNEVVATFAAPDLLNFSYMIDPALTGAVTMVVDADMTARQAWETFEHILWLGGGYASINPGFIHILPFDKMPKERRLFAEHELQPNVVVDFIPVKYKKSSDLINQIRPFMTDGASAVDLVDSNTLVIIEAPANIEKLRELISRLDNKGEREWPAKSFACHEVEADVLAEELNQLLPVLGLPIATGTGASGGAIKVVALPRVGAVVVSAALPEVVDEVGRWVKALDHSNMMDKEEIYFYNAKHCTVEKLTQALESFFNAEVSVSESNSTSTSSSRSRSRTTSSSTSSNRNTSSSSSRTGTTSGNRTGTSTTSNNRTNRSSSSDADLNRLTTTVFETEVKAYADTESNRMTIRTTPRTWMVIKAFLERHDIAPRQVSIQATIAEITLNKSTEYGVTYAISKLLAHNDYRGGGVTAGNGAIGELLGAEDMAGNIAAIGGVDAGLGFIFQKLNDPIAFFSAVAGKGNTKILSEPHLTVTSGSEAYLQSGKKVAVATSSTTYVTSDGNTSNNYEYVDVGVLMTVTPYITAGNDVRLIIAQESSNVVASTIANSITPDIETKKVETEMVISDGSTIMMGGMIQTNDQEKQAGIPLLMDIPYLGNIFRSNYTSSVRSELLILITVNVIDNGNFQDELVRKYKQSLEAIEAGQHERY